MDNSTNLSEILRAGSEFLYVNKHTLLIKSNLDLRTKMFIMCITLFITTKTNTLISKVPGSLINRA